MKLMKNRLSLIAIVSAISILFSYFSLNMNGFCYKTNSFADVDRIAENAINDAFNQKLNYEADHGQAYISTKDAFVRRLVELGNFPLHIDPESPPAGWRFTAMKMFGYIYLYFSIKYELE